MKSIYKIFVLILLVSTISIINSCTKESDAPENPYDKIDRTGNNSQNADPDPNTIVGLHKNIFFPKCANPGCHDGTFEPDYRTVESTFATLVYQGVNKTCLEDSLKFYSYRVIPHNTADSWIIERLTTQSQEYMPSNAERLSTAEIDHVKNWINAGCPDVNGVLPVKPNLLPNILYFVALNMQYQRLDTIRVNNYILNPFYLSKDSMVQIAFLATDTADGADATSYTNYTVHSIHFSLSKNDFSHDTVINATVPYAGLWIATFPVKWSQGSTVYFRIHVNDGHHATDAEFPRNETLDYYKTYFSFYVQ